MRITLPNGKWRKRLKIKVLPPFAELHKVRAENCKMFVYKYILRESNEELAKQYHCQKDSVRMLLFRARQRALGLMEEGEGHRDET